MDEEDEDDQDDEDDGDEDDDEEEEDDNDDDDDDDDDEDGEDDKEDDDDEEEVAWGSLMHPDFFLLCTLIFSRLCTLTSSTLSEVVRNIGNSRAIEEVIFFSLVHPGALFARFGVAFAPWTSLASTEVLSIK